MVCFRRQFASLEVSASWASPFGAGASDTQVILLDSITRLGRAYNTVVPACQLLSIYRIARKEVPHARNRIDSIAF